MMSVAFKCKEGMAVSMLTKQFLKSKPECKVTFKVPDYIQAETVHLVGDFNNWNETSHPMKKAKDGSFSLVVNLPVGNRYQFRYLVNAHEWHNDPEPDARVPNPHGSDNSVVSTEIE